MKLNKKKRKLKTNNKIRQKKAKVSKPNKITNKKIMKEINRQMV